MVEFLDLNVQGHSADESREPKSEYIWNQKTKTKALRLSDWMIRLVRSRLIIRLEKRGKLLTNGGCVQNAMNGQVQARRSRQAQTNLPDAFTAKLKRTVFPSLIFRQSAMRPNAHGAIATTLLILFIVKPAIL